VPAIASEQRGSGRRRWLPRWTLRLRLTILYGGLFLIAGAVLLAVTYALVAGDTPVTASKSTVLAAGSPAQFAVPPQLRLSKAGDAQGYVFESQGSNGNGLQIKAFQGKVDATFRKLTAAQEKQLSAVSASARTQLTHQRSSELSSLLTKSAIALAIMAVLSIGLGWLMAGRTLRPMRTMSNRARGISERNLHERLSLDGPDDELKELGDTFDGLLGRLETAFESQRRFVANASHELRTPVTLTRTLAEVALVDPEATMASMRDTCERVIAAGERQERIIESLLTLARSERGVDERTEFDLGELVQEVVRGVPVNGIEVESVLGEAITSGDPAMVERLVSNLVENALHYNEPDGWVRAWTGIRDGQPTLSVTNTGPVIPAERVPDLFEPFRRVNGDRTGNARGLGLGLSIVGAIASAHDADVRATPRNEGGLEVEIRFPRPRA
jgi:signal transduction histidine kinase